MEIEKKDTRFEALKEELLIRGSVAIEDFIGQSIGLLSKDEINSLMNEVYYQMPEEDLEEYYKKYNPDMKIYTVSMAVDGRIDVDVKLPVNASKEEILKAARMEFGSADLSGIDVIGFDAVNCSDMNGILFDF